MWKKVLYVGVAFIFGVIIFFIGFISNQVNFIHDLVGNAIVEERYPDAIRVLYGGYFDTRSTVEDDSEELELKIYPATTIVDVTYGKDDAKEQYTKCDNAYSINIFNPRFATGAISNSKIQKTGLKFCSQDYTYDFYYVCNQDYNSNSYVAEPTSLSEAVLNQEKNFIYLEEDRNLTMMCVIFSETQINEITAKLQGQAIEKLAVLDNEGEVVYTINIKLDFEEQYFNDMREFVTTYNKYLNDYNTTEDQDKKKEIAETFQNYSSTWENETYNKYMTEKGYTKGASSEETSPGSLIWKTIGIVALYLLVVALFYMLLFHFDLIRRIFSKDTYKNYGKKKNSGTYVNGKLVNSNNTKNNKATNEPKQNSIKAIETKKSKVIDAKVDEVEAPSENEEVVQTEEPVAPEVPAESQEIETVEDAKTPNQED